MLQLRREEPQEPRFYFTQVMLHQCLSDLRSAESDEKQALIHSQMARKMLLLAADNTLLEKPKAGAVQVKSTGEIRLLFQVLRHQQRFEDMQKYLKLLESQRENEEFNMIEAEVLAAKEEWDKLSALCGRIVSDYLKSLLDNEQSKAQLPDWRVWDYLSCAQVRLQTANISGSVSSVTLSASAQISSKRNQLTPQQ